MEEGQEIQITQLDGKEATPRMDLETAKRVLQTITDTPEESFTDASKIDKIGEYGVHEIREAMRLVTQDLLDTHNATTDFGYPVIRKDAAEGKLRLEMKNLGAKWGEVNTNAEEISLDVIVSRRDYFGPIIGNRFLLVDDATGEQGVYAGFRDVRQSAQPEGASLRKLTDNFDIRDYQTMVRGLRWTAANLLRWDEPGVVMPEQLSRSIPPESPPQPTLQAA